jgi:hypothetical protein
MNQEQEEQQHHPFTITIDDGWGGYKYTLNLPNDVAIYDIIKAIGEKYQVEIPLNGTPI